MSSGLTKEVSTTAEHKITIDQPTSSSIIINLQSKIQTNKPASSQALKKDRR